jgi:starch phosphorylase
MVGVTLLHRGGYFFQHLDDQGSQVDRPVRWSPADHLEPTGLRFSVQIRGRTVHLTAWRRDVRGVTGHVVPIYFIDADLSENVPEDRTLTDRLYGGDHAHRLCQEIILGVGGVRLLRCLGIAQAWRYHMNEGHAALLAGELLDEESRARGLAPDDAACIEAVRQRCVFTTHTPLAAGHDRFGIDMVREIMDARDVQAHAAPFHLNGMLDTTVAAMNLSRYANGVAKRHAVVTRAMFPERTIDSITNGIHASTWVSPSVGAMLDRNIPGWRTRNALLARATEIPEAEVASAHALAKRRLIDAVNRTTNAGLDRDAFTIGCARRATPYKRLDLILSDLPRLEAMAREHGRVQILFSGKAHPRDGGGRDVIRRLVGAGASLPPEVRVTFIPGYDMEWCGLLVAGSDLWLNTPQRPLEASGTSGMKAAANGVPSLSVLDGWWLEGCVEGVTGWAIGPDREANPDWEVDARDDAAALLGKLESVILPMFHSQPDAYLRVMRASIAINGAYFNTQRMMQEYVLRAYAGEGGVRVGEPPAGV